MVTANRKKGNLGEDIAVAYLKKNSYRILERNWLKNWGEIDIIAQKDKNELSFIEVKVGAWAEENLTVKKRKNLIKTARTYLLEKYGNENLNWQFDVIMIYLDFQRHKAQIRHLKNINFQ